jgi:ribosomal protein S18 acetylase RimI-like enzyme
MAVDPNHQRQGVGSMLMRIFCDHVDQYGLDALVLSSPAGIRLYSKFGFRAVGVVESKHGNFTSILRTSSVSPGENIRLPT